MLRLHASKLRWIALGIDLVTIAIAYVVAFELRNHLIERYGIGEVLSLRNHLVLGGLVLVIWG